MSDRYNKRNSSGCMDQTAYQAIQNIEGDSNARFKQLLNDMYGICNDYNFQIKGRVVLIDNVTGKIYK